MPLLTLHLLTLKDIQPHAFTKSLHQTSPNTKIIVSSLPRYPVVNATTSPFAHLNKHWDLLLLLSGSIPSSLHHYIESSYALNVGIPSKLLAGYPARNEQLRREAKTAGLTGSLEGAKVPESSQRLENSPDLLSFMERFEKEYDGPVTMLNLLQFRDGGKDSYYQYGQEFIEVAKKRGGDAKIVGNVIVGGNGEGDAWHEIAIVHYASLRHFCDMLAGEDYQRINERYRLPALEDTLLLCTTEFDTDETKAKL